MFKAFLLVSKAAKSEVIEKGDAAFNFWDGSSYDLQPPSTVPVRALDPRVLGCFSTALWL